MINKKGDITMKITDLLGIEYPIFQGAMAQISMAPLVSAVSEAGGLGVLASGGMTPDELRDQIQEIKRSTSKPFAVNLMLMMPGVEDLVQVIIEEDVPVVTTGAGTPKRFMPALKEAGIKVFPVVPNVKIAKKMEELGCDGVIAEGMEAGGHIGSVTTMVLTPSVVNAINIPVITAGGISSPQAYRAALALGASGVQCGSIFLATHECPIPQSYKEKVLEADEVSTTLTGVQAGHPVRVLQNKLTDEYLKLEKENASSEELENLTQNSLYKAAKLGDMEWGSIMAGQSSGLVTKIQSVPEVLNYIIGK